MLAKPHVPFLPKMWQESPCRSSTSTASVFVLAHDVGITFDVVSGSYYAQRHQLELGSRHTVSEFVAKGASPAKGDRSSVGCFHGFCSDAHLRFQQ